MLLKLQMCLKHMMIILPKHLQSVRAMINKSLFIDTSAFYALMDRSDQNYQKASGFWKNCLNDTIELKTNNYIVIEIL